MKKIFYLFFLIFFLNLIFGQSINFNQGKIKQKRYFQVIPYKKIMGVPVVTITINGEMYNFVFDTGAPLTISDKLLKKLSLPILGQVDGKDASGEIGTTKHTLLPELHLQGISFNNVPCFVFHEDDVFFECLEIDGLIGSNMLRNSIVHFDEQNSQIIITNNINRISIKRSVRQKIELHHQSNPFILVHLNRSGYKILFDSGQSSFFELDINSFYSSNKFDKISESEGSFTYCFNGIPSNQKHILCSIPEFDLGNTKFNNVIATTTHDTDSRIGSKLFEYGKVTLDYKKKRFYFEPFKNINLGELSKLPWSIDFTFKNDRLVVGIIWDKSLESQINLGDEILGINGIDIQSKVYCELVQYFHIPDGDVLFLELKDIITGGIKSVEVNKLEVK